MLDLGERLGQGVPPSNNTGVGRGAVVSSGKGKGCSAGGGCAAERRQKRRKVGG